MATTVTFSVTVTIFAVTFQSLRTLARMYGLYLFFTQVLMQFVYVYVYDTRDKGFL